jgi:hypothetical protein
VIILKDSGGGSTLNASLFSYLIYVFLNFKPTMSSDAFIDFKKEF